MADWIEVVLEADLVDGKPTRVNFGDEPVLLLRAGEEVFAIGNQCTHQGAGLDRGVARISGSVRTVTCPAHGSMFNLETGEVMRPPATKPVAVYDVRVEEGEILLRRRDAGD